MERLIQSEDPMTSLGKTAEAEHCALPSSKNKSCLLSVIQQHVDVCKIDRNQPVLVLGGGTEDREILSACGFSNILLTNLDSDRNALDAEDIDLPDDSFPVVFAHAVLHHCRSPHKAVGEMIRVCQKHVLFLEPNDSWALRTLVRLGFSFPYELAAVAANGYRCGGVRNGPIPNFIYRWTGREVVKSVSAYHPERQIEVRAHPYWDFYVNDYELLVRKETKVSALAESMGPRNLIALLRFSQMFLNMLPPVRSQGNKFFCAISKQGLQPWIDVREGQYQLKREMDSST